MKTSAHSVQALWRRRELVSVLASSDFKSRYRRLGLGLLWAAINPLIQGLAIALVLHLIGARFAVELPYALFVLTGIMPWTFFVTALTTGTSSLLDAGAIVQRVALPRAALPTATLASNLINFAFILGTLLVIVAVMAAGRMALVWLLPAAVLLEVALVYGLTLLTSALNVRYRDVGQLVQAATVVWFWATPIVYPLAILSSYPVLEALVRANPMTGVLSLYRTALVGLPLDRLAVLASAGWTVLFLLLGWVVFSRREGTVADFI